MSCNIGIKHDFPFIKIRYIGPSGSVENRGRIGPSGSVENRGRIGPSGSVENRGRSPRFSTLPEGPSEC